MSSGQTLLVTGASGQLGRRVVELLLESSETDIIATTRTPDKLADLAQRGVDVRYASFDEPDSLASAFAGADRLLLISTDALGERQRQHEAAVDAAVAAGVKHILYTSLISADDTPVTLGPEHVATENAIAASGVSYTFLRNNVYAETLIRALTQAQSMDGQLFSAMGDGKVAYVTREDCAQAASAALADSFDGKRILDITGPEALSQHDIAELGTSIGSQPITYIPLPTDTLAENLVQAGLPKSVADLITSFDAAAAQGKQDKVSSAVEDLTGRKPIHVADFLAANLPSSS
ncbi:MAG: NAD(P)-dependent oxidoreductase [Anaerolineaceae bacterium]|nr:NAD(P)-dependent oxidoreductase [Anaerolineaceae bacterium]